MFAGACCVRSSIREVARASRVGRNSGSERWSLRKKISSSSSFFFGCTVSLLHQTPVRRHAVEKEGEKQEEPTLCTLLFSRFSSQLFGLLSSFSPHLIQPPQGSDTHARTGVFPLLPVHLPAISTLEKFPFSVTYAP